MDSTHTSTTAISNVPATTRQRRRPQPIGYFIPCIIARTLGLLCSIAGIAMNSYLAAKWTEKAGMGGGAVAVHAFAALTDATILVIIFLRRPPPEFSCPNLYSFFDVSIFVGAVVLTVLMALSDWNANEGSGRVELPWAAALGGCIIVTSVAAGLRFALLILNCVGCCVFRKIRKRAKAAIQEENGRLVADMDAGKALPAQESKNVALAELK